MMTLDDALDIAGEGWVGRLGYASNIISAEVRRLQAENERLRKDAERYQWLRAKARTGEGAPDGLYVGVDSDKFIGRWALFGSAADKAIDAARSAK